MLDKTGFDMHNLINGEDSDRSMPEHGNYQQFTDVFSHYPAGPVIPV